MINKQSFKLPQIDQYLMLRNITKGGYLRHILHRQRNKICMTHNKFILVLYGIDEMTTVYFIQQIPIM